MKLPERKNAAAQLRYFHVWDETPCRTLDEGGESVGRHEDEKSEAQSVIYLVISV